MNLTSTPTTIPPICILTSSDPFSLNTNGWFYLSVSVDHYWELPPVSDVVSR